MKKQTFLMQQDHPPPPPTEVQNRIFTLNI